MGGTSPEGNRIEGEEEKLAKRIALCERQERAELDLTNPAGGNDRFDPRGQDYNAREEEKKRAKAQKKEERKTEKDRRRELGRRGWNGKGITEEQRALALQGWIRVQAGKTPKQRHLDAATACGLRLGQRNLDLHILDTQALTKRRLEFRAQGLAPNTAGGFLVPEGFVQNLEIALLQYANVREWADVMRTASGQDLPWPTVNDTTTKGRRLQENATVAEQDMMFGQTIMHAYKYTSGLVQVPVELMEDSAFDLAAILGELLGIRIGRVQADEFTTGLGGAGVPQGYVTGATQGVQAASSTAIAADDLYSLKHSVDPAYRAAPGVGFTFHDQILLAIKKLKDGMGRYLWQMSLAGGKPDTIDGDPYFINQSQASTIASGNKTVVYGALQKFKIRDVSQIRLRRLVERFADSDQEGFVMFMRSDSQLLDAGTHPIRYLVH